MQHIPFIIFFFAIGACVGSFLNVIVWRLPRGESIVSPPSHCPKCNKKLAWYDNIPVFGWIALRGKCRYCGLPISIRYPIIEAITGGLFVLYYVHFFIRQDGPCSPLRDMSIDQDWPMYVLYMFMISALFAASMIDAEHFIIPIEIPWLMAGIAMVVHAFIDLPFTPGALNANPTVAALSAGAGVGLFISILLLRFEIIPQSFAESAPLLEIEKEALEKQGAEMPPEFTRAQLNVEMRKEMLFLLPALVLGAVWLLLTWKVPPIARFWASLVGYHWLSGFLGSLWGALVGAFVIWLTRILGTLGFGREAMGLGDVHLMFGIGAVIGAAGSVVVFFIAPFVGLAFALYKLLFREGREVPYGPFLSIATAIVVLFYCRIIDHLTPATEGLVTMLRQMLPG